MEDCNKSIEGLTTAVKDMTSVLERLAASKEGRFSSENIVKHIEEHTPEKLSDILESCAISGLLKDNQVSDILVNGPFEVYVDRGGQLEKTDAKFSSHAELLKFADAIAHSLNRKLDPRRPLMDARLPDGSRVNIIAPPMAVDGLSISIRKFSSHNITLDVLEQYGSITPMMKEFLKACANCHLNIIISGGTGSGKTTMLNAVSQYISPKERIVSIEDSIELKLQQPHVVRLETKNPEVLGDRTREVNIRDLLVNALRMRPDRIIIGEVRGGEAYDMIQSMNTGHDGSMATIHANNPREAVARIESMISQVSNNTPIAVIRKQVVSAVNLIIQVTRLENGKRMVTYVSEIIGMEGDTPTISDIFIMRQKGVDASGKLIMQQEWTGVPPRHPKLAAYVKTHDILRNR